MKFLFLLIVYVTGQRLEEMPKKIKNRSRFMCIVCKVDTGKIGEHYMLVDPVWNKVHTSAIGMLCIGCLEKRLGRKLVPSDFHPCYINNKNYGSRSARLTNRMGI